MTNEPQPGDGLPLINAMGVNEAARKPVLREMLKAQLEYVYSEIEHYVPMKPRGFGDDSQMPHEWGSLDTYDDLRSSLGIAAKMADALLDFQVDDDAVEFIAELAADYGVCAFGAGVLETAYGGKFDAEQEEDLWIRITKLDEEG